MEVEKVVFGKVLRHGGSAKGGSTDAPCVFACQALTDQSWSEERTA